MKATHKYAALALPIVLVGLGFAGAHLTQTPAPSPQSSASRILPNPNYPNGYTAPGGHHHHHHNHGAEVDAAEIDPNQIVSVEKHGDHYHVILADGTELVTHSDPRTTSFNAAEAKAQLQAAKQGSATIVEVVAHGDHYHIRLSNGVEYISYTDPRATAKRSSDGSYVIPVEKDTGAPVTPHSEAGNTHSLGLHFDGVLARYVAGDMATIFAHSTNSAANSYRWTLHRRGYDAETLSESGSTLNLPMALQDDEATLHVEVLDASGKILETHSTTLRVSAQGDLMIQGLKNHYHTGDMAELKARLLGDIAPDSYAWYLTRKGETTLVSSTNSWSAAMDASYNNADVRLIAYKNKQEIARANATLIINDHGASTPSPTVSTDAKDAEDALKEMGLDPVIIRAAKNASYYFPKDNPAFPAQETDPEKLRAWLGSLKKFSLSYIENPFTKSGLEYLTGVEGFIGESLSLNAQDEEAFKQLPFYSHLKELHLPGVKGTDGAFLSGMSELNILDINKAQNINSLEFARGLTKLEGIAFKGLGISDVSALAIAKNLRIIEADNNKIGDLSALSGLPLEELLLNNNNLKSLDSLRGFTSLRKLEVSNVNTYGLFEGKYGTNEISDLSALDGASALEKVVAANVGLERLGITKSKTLLAELDVHNNELQIVNLDITPNVGSLNLSNNALGSVLLTRDLASLDSVVLSSNQLTNISFIEHMPALTRAMLANNKIASVALNRPNVSVDWLDVSNNALSRLDIFNDWKNIRTVDASGNLLSSIDRLTSNTLYYLDVSRNNLGSVGDISGLTILDSLVAKNAHIDTIEHIQNGSVSTLDISNKADTEGANTLSSVKGIENLPNLRVLEFANNPQITTINDTHNDSLERGSFRGTLYEAPDSEKYPSFRDWAYSSREPEVTEDSADNTPETTPEPAGTNSNESATEEPAVPAAESENDSVPASSEAESTPTEAEPTNPYEGVSPIDLENWGL